MPTSSWAYSTPVVTVPGTPAVGFAPSFTCPNIPTSLLGDVKFCRWTRQRFCRHDDLLRASPCCSNWSHRHAAACARPDPSVDLAAVATRSHRRPDRRGVVPVPPHGASSAAAVPQPRRGGDPSRLSPPEGGRGCRRGRGVGCGPGAAAAAPPLGRPPDPQPSAAGFPRTGCPHGTGAPAPVPTTRLGATAEVRVASGAATARPPAPRRLADGRLGTDPPGQRRGGLVAPDRR